ncbi:pyridoxamine 5'-phosphate oxidase family protein [Methanolobus halotolerans]|uniref:Pyridoxamine 5-phosphate oxidase n=1 Tax=Methanolobus halotolerans TaxID=2052935 RepID=A0A4E0Q9F4_9EURY|nr:pyridoxamine 5'-phosphate oxidase family protein [Methanolobus halotolerans]TGC08767.1 pyridoxamine 5-phosphate oxidase [Methanolobus halotolerans]
MSEEIRKKISNYLSSHNWLNLGTVDQEGRPMVHTMAYVSEGSKVYFTTNKNTHKVSHMLNNPNVAFTVDEDDVNVMEIKGVQMEGKASLVTDREEVNKALGMMTEKYPFMSDMPSNDEYVLFKVDPVKAYYLDYTKGFNHRDEETY